MATRSRRNRVFKYLRRDERPRGFRDSGSAEKVLGAMEGALRYSLDRSLRRAMMLTALLLLSQCTERAESIVPRPSCLNRQEGLRVATENVKNLERQLASVQRALALAERERAIATQRERSACRPENSTEASGAGGHLQRTLRKSVSHLLVRCASSVHKRAALR